MKSLRTKALGGFLAILGVTSACRADDKLLALVSLKYNSICVVPDRIPLGPDVRTMRIACYDYELPEWWDSVSVSIPKEILEWKSSLDIQSSTDLQEWLRKSEEFREQEKKRGGWKENFKFRVIAFDNSKTFPSFLGSLHFDAGEYARAGRIYADLYQLADSQGLDKDSLRCFLAHSAGECYFRLKDYELAGLWYRRSAEYLAYKDQGISYYAKMSADMIDTCDESAAIVRSRRK